MHQRLIASMSGLCVVLSSSAMFSGGLMLSAEGEALAQPTRRNVPLITPKKAAAKKPTTSTGARKTAADKSGAGGKPAMATPSAQLPFRPMRGGRVNLNFDEIELTELVKSISAMTGRRFLLGGKVKQIKTTIISPKDVSPTEAYMAFLSVLESNGLTVIPHGRYLKIVDSAGVVSKVTPLIGTSEPVPYVDRYVTRMYRLRHADAGEIAGVLGKFKSKDGDITVHAPGNLLIITDTGANIRRLMRIIEELDAGGKGEQLWLQPVHNMAATDVAAKLTELLEAGGGRAKVLAEERSNQLVIVANESDYRRMLELVKRIDVPLNTGGGGVHVLRLQHARCNELQGTLGGVLGSGGGGGGARPAPRNNARGATARAGTARASTGGGGTATAGPDGGIFEGEVRVNCDESTNSLIAVSSLRDYARLRGLIDKLDQPRRQVFIEAVIMDVSVTNTRDFGLGFHGGAPIGAGDDQSVLYGSSNPDQANGGIPASLTGVPANLEALAFGVRGPDLVGGEQIFGTGLSIPAFGVVLHALSRSGNTNVLATPHILATDNIPAEISIGQNIPLQTNVGGGLGGLAGLAGAAGGAAGALGGLGGLLGGGGFSAPRQDIGIRLSITPQINDSDQVRMDITEEFSDAGSPQGALGAVPINKRTANTTVIIKDQQTVVIGGLVRSRKTKRVTKVPILGDIPVLGLLFRRTVNDNEKTNLLLVLTPHIVRNQNDLREIFERKMQERQEFLDRYFVFDDSLPWEPLQDYSRTNGLVEHVRQTQLKVATRERLAANTAPPGPKAHEPVDPIALPSMAAPAGAAPKPKPRGRSTAKVKARPRNIRVPGGRTVRPKRFRIE